MTDETYLRQKAVQWLQYSWAGYTGQQWVGVFGGYKIVPLTRHRTPFWIVNHAGKQVHFSTYHLNPDFLPSVVAKLQSSSIQFLMGYPSAIGIVAQYLAARNQSVPLKGVFLSSEPIYDWQAEAIRQAFGCRVFNYFAATEKVISAISCGHSLNLHVNEEICVPEFTHATPAVGGRVLLGTLLTNYAMPLIRYELHDVSSEVPDPCPCGRAHGLIGPIDTKAEDFIVTPRGSLVSASLLTFPFKTARGIIASQIEQLDLHTLVVKVVTNELFRPEDSAQLCADIGSCVGDEMRIEIKRVTDIPRTNNGKFKFVVSAISQDHVLNLLT
jgi:phenylacetate-CoA ligase